MDLHRGDRSVNVLYPLNKKIHSEAETNGKCQEYFQNALPLRNRVSTLSYGTIFPSC